MISPETTIELPGFAKPFSLALPAEIVALRDRALDQQHGPQLRCPEVRLSDAAAWAQHTGDEDWLIWRGRRTASRLRAIPIQLDPGERIVGRPALRRPTKAEQADLAAAGAVLESMPPYPGGDAGHFHPNYDKLFRKGIGGILREIAELRGALRVTPEQVTFYDACAIALDGMADYVRRTAEACDEMAQADIGSAAHWRELAGRCRRIASEPPRTFHEAIQLMFLTEVTLWFGEDHSLTTPGRMDQTLRPFYEADLAAGRLTAREAFELIACLYIQLNRLLWPGSAISVMVGGQDAAGRDVTNDLTYLCLAARQATQLVYPSVGLAWHPGTPDELMDFSVAMVGTGIGDPAFFNDEVIAAGLRDQGVAEEDVYNYMNSTCVEIKVVGASNIWVTAPYFNCAQALLDAMARLSGNGSEGGYDALLAAVRANLAREIRDAATRLDRVWKKRVEAGCFPLASCFISDCLARGLDFDRGGARYNWVENSFVGLANVVDGLVAVKHLVYEDGELSLAELYRILQDDYEGHEPLRQRILNRFPKYGNDLAEPDALAQEIADFLIAETESQTVGLHRYVPGFFCWIKHEQFGSETGATPDGRKASRALADGAGAGQGRERKGPTASVLSTTRWCHQPVLGGLVHNAKFTERLFDTEADRLAVRNVIETYLKRGGFELQINAIGKDDLLDAQAHPERYQDLLVRVAGYSDYFVHLNRNMQDEVIQRTEFREA